MATNLDLDDALLREALRAGGHPTKKATVHEALREYIARRRRLQAVKAFGTFDFDPDYDAHKARHRR